MTNQEFFILQSTGIRNYAPCEDIKWSVVDVFFYIPIKISRFAKKWHRTFAVTSNSHSHLFDRSWLVQCRSSTLRQSCAYFSCAGRVCKTIHVFSITHIKIFAVCVFHPRVITCQVFIHRYFEFISAKWTSAFLHSQQAVFPATSKIVQLVAAHGLPTRVILSNAEHGAFWQKKKCCLFVFGLRKAQLFDG